ncbi:MAG: 2-hydroxychromene-2-carboxylate isomerase/DsbA-like thioredoxin domain [Nitrospira sp.]|jgi:predicted DsbA family dithiol-disulfide isomerase|nr:MAG: 2-hydroxychromene-2-carboxylate isomerase/DsbA-like thioredoxin domain [Nitrospira sp.]
MTGRSIAIEVYSDVVCPWCYIGKRRLEQALDTTKGRGETPVLWRPFQLNPTMPKVGMDRRAYLEAKFGGPGEMKAIQERVAAVGTGAGIDFMFDRIERTPNTFDAHRLIWFAGQHHRQDAMVEELFHGYFTEGLNIGQAETLVTLAVRAGLDGDKVGRLLQTDEGVEAVRQEEARGHRLGIRGVPYFVLNGTATLSGAQPVETFVSTIERVTS